MATKDFLPSGNDALRAFAQNYSQHISAGAEAYGLSADVADRLADLTADYAAKLAALNDPRNRNPIAFREKAEAKAALADYVRQTARVIQGSMTVTSAQRIVLQLPVRKAHRTPAAAISAAPDLRVESVVGHHVRIRVRDAAGLGRGRPADARGATVYSFVAGPGDAPSPPAGRAGWRCEGNLVGNGSAVVAFPPDVRPGTKVYLAAAWYNARGAGPGCTPVAAIIGIEGSLVRAA